MKPKRPAARSMFATLSAALLLLGRANLPADEFDDLVRSFMNEQQVPGVCVAAIRQGREIRRGCYGVSNVEWNTPAKQETVFEIGALTMEFTAAAALLLVQESRLDLRDSVSEYLKEAPASWEKITVRHLLEHTSGLRNFAREKGFGISRPRTREQFIAEIARQPLEYEPGAKAEVNFTAYRLLGYVLESASGRGAWALMRERLFDPAGMTDIRPRNPETIIPERADGYTMDGGGLRRRNPDILDSFTAGDLACSIGDLARWESALHEGRIISPDGLRLMSRPGRLNDDSESPFGWGCRAGVQGKHRRVIWSGTSDGFSSCHARYPETGMSVMVAANLGEPECAVRLAEKIAGQLLSTPETP